MPVQLLFAFKLSDKFIERCNLNHKQMIAFPHKKPISDAKHYQIDPSAKTKGYFGVIVVSTSQSLR